MTNTLDGFCRDLLDDESFQEALDPERLAARFVRFFGLSDRPALNELTGLLQEAGFGTVAGRDLDSLKGVHASAPGGGYDIYYRQDLWDGGAGAHRPPRSLRDHPRDPVRPARPAPRRSARCAARPTGSPRRS